MTKLANHFSLVYLGLFLDTDDVSYIKLTRKGDNMSFKPQQMLVEERGLENQIKRLKDLVPTKADVENDELLNTVGYLRTQLVVVIENLEDIKDCIKSENDRILKYSFKQSAKGTNFEIKS